MRSIIASILALDFADLIVIDGVNYSIVNNTDAGIVLVAQDRKDRFETFTHTDIWNRYYRGSLTVERGHFDLTTARLRLHVGASSLEALTAKEQEYCLHAARCCDLFLQLNGKDSESFPRTRAGFDAAAKVISAQLLAEAAERTICVERSPKAAPSSKPTAEVRGRAGDSIVVLRPPKGRTLERWLKTYLAFDCHPLALRPRFFRCGRSESPLQSEVQAMLTQAAISYLDERRPSIRAFSI